MQLESRNRAIETAVMGGMPMSEICRMHDVLCDTVRDVCRRAGLRYPPKATVGPDDVLSILRQMRTREESRQVAVVLGVTHLRVLNILCGRDRAVPAEYYDRCDLAPSRVCMIYHGEEWGDPVHPELCRRIQSGRTRRSVTEAAFVLAEHPGLWLLVLDTLHGRGCMGPLASRDVIEEISERCAVSYYCVWLVAQELTHRPSDTLRWPGERARRLSPPEYAPISLAIPWDDLEEHERSALVEAHAKWDDRRLWLPVEVWYKLGMHGVRGSLRYPSPKDLPTFKDAIRVPGMGGRRADALGRIWSRRGRLCYRRHMRVAGYLVSRMVYEAWNGRALDVNEVVDFVNGDRRDCRPENLFSRFAF